MAYDTTQLPGEADVQPWFDAVCALWDDPALYVAMAARARQIAGERYSEDVSRRRHVDYFTSLTAGNRPLEPSHALREDGA
jgi:glycosyltransferase involved in cell wall biosynthesis